MSMAEILILCHAISYYRSCLIPTIFLKFKSALCTILTNVQTAFNLCRDSRSPLRALDQPVVEEVLLDVVQRGDVVALPQELLKLYSVFCILYSVLYILYSVLLYYVFCIFLVNRIKFRIFQYWDIVALPKFYFSSTIVSSSYSQCNRPAVSDQMPAGCLTWWEYHHFPGWLGSLWSTCHLY